MKNRILFLHFTPPSVVGGVEHIMAQQARLLEEHGFSVQFVAGRPGTGGRPVEVIPEIDAAGPSNIRLERELEQGIVSAAFYEAQSAVERRLFPLAREADFIIAHNAFTLHFSLPLTAALWQWVTRRESSKVIAWCHDLSWCNSLYAPAMHVGFPWDLLRQRAPNTAYVTVSHERMYELSRLWGEATDTITVVPNGIDPETFLDLSEDAASIIARYHLFDRDMVLLLPVRITRRKNVELSLRVIRALKDRGIDVFFLVSGPQAPHHPGRSATYLDELKELRAQLEIDDEVVFLADVAGQNPDGHMVSDLFAIADGLLFPSSQEGFGLPILEAGIRRVPVFLSDIPVFREVGGDDVTTFNLADHPNAIADGIIRSLDAGPSRLFRRVLRTYRWDAIFEQKMLPLLSS